MISMLPLLHSVSLPITTSTKRMEKGITMKQFELPEIEIQIFAVEDIVTTSTLESGNPEQLPMG